MRIRALAMALFCAVVATPRAARSDALGSEFQINTYTTSSQGGPALSADAAGNFVVVWHSYKQDGYQWGIFGQRYASDGTTRGGEFQVGAYTTTNILWPAIAAADSGAFLVAWNGDNQDVFARLHDSNGSAVGAEFRVNSYTTASQRYASIVAETDGDFIVVWSSFGPDGSGDGVFGQRYASDGSPNGSNFQINTVTAGNQRSPTIALGGTGEFVVTWFSRVSVTDYDIRARRFGSDGAAIGDDFLVNTYTTSQQRYPSVGAGPSGDFVIAWQSYAVDGNHYGIAAQRYASDGTALGSEFVVNTTYAGKQYRPRVAVLSNDDFVVVWDGGSGPISGRLFESDGTAQGAEFKVNSYTVSGDKQYRPAVTAGPARSFVVAWESWGSSGTDSSLASIQGRRFGTLGTVTVTSPNRSSDRWGEETTQRIRWTHTMGAGQAWDVDLSRDGGGNFSSIGTGIASGSVAGNFYYTVPDTCSSGTDASVVRVSNSAAPAVTDDSVTFDIDCQAETNVYRPNTDVPAGSGTTIWWRHNVGHRSRIQLSLARDGNFAGGNVSTISSVVMSQWLNKGKFNWIPGCADPGCSGPGCRIRADWIDGTGERRRTSPFFDITPCVP